MKLENKYVEPFPSGKRGDGFGNLADYREGRPHRGLDWTVPGKSLIRAVGSGVIRQVGWSDVLGWYVVQSIENGKLFALYAHLYKKPGIQPGKFVTAGKTAIGRVGSTGTASTGDHLHFGVATVENVATCAYGKLLDPAILFV
jgi:murein DD-endopeptidase MepM/ murein hydrolase activator NlpD